MDKKAKAKSTYYCITDRKGRELKTEKDFIAFYMEYTKEQKHFNPLFDELEFLKQERKDISELIEINEPIDVASGQFKFELTKYLAGFLNRKLFVFQEAEKNSPENFENSANEIALKEFNHHVKVFEEKMKAILDKQTQIDFIKNEVEKTKSTIQNWLSEGLSNSTNYHDKGEFEAGQKYLSYLKNSLETVDTNIYWIKDGKQVLSTWDYIQECTSDNFKANFTPFHDFNLLKENRLTQFKEKQTEFIEFRELNHLETKEFEMNSFYFAWLNDEQKSIEKWLSGKVNISTHIEIFKYQKYVQSEIEKINLILKVEDKQETEKKTEQQEQQTENNFTLSTIEDWLFEFKDKMIGTDYQTLVSALMQYFVTGAFPTLAKPIQINGRPNKKLFGWALNRIFEAKGKGIEKELLQFAKQNISLFTDVQFDENNILKSNLYKYFTTQTK